MMMHEAVDSVDKALSVSVVVDRYDAAQVSCLSKIQELVSVNLMMHCTVSYP